MNEEINKLVDVLKKQAEIFLMDANEFYPFGTVVNKFNLLQPIGAYVGDANPSSNELIEVLEKRIKQGVDDGDYLLAAIAIDVLIRKDDKKYDGVELRFFEKSKDVYKKFFKYTINENGVDFIEHRE